MRRSRGRHRRRTIRGTLLLSGAHARISDIHELPAAGRPRDEARSLHALFAGRSPQGAARPLLEELHRIDQGAVDAPQERDSDKAPCERQFERHRAAILIV
jgi:hypothetical protein